VRESNAEIQELKKANGASQNVSQQVALLSSKVSHTLVVASSSIPSSQFLTLTLLPYSF